MTVDDIHKKKGLTIGQKILDYMGSTELIANLFPYFPDRGEASER